LFPSFSVCFVSSKVVNEPTTGEKTKQTETNGNKRSEAFYEEHQGERSIRSSHTNER